MAKLTMEQYIRRNENAAKKMQENAANEALSEQQHEALAALCRARHELHSNMDECVRNDPGYKKNLIICNVALNDSGLPCMEFIPNDVTDYIDIDTIEEIGEIEEIEGSKEEKMSRLNNNYERIYSELEALNKKIEQYLQKIDRKYHTNYAPTGALRIL